MNTDLNSQKLPDLPAVDQLNFEEALNELEQIVSSLEQENLSLEYSLALFERGQELARYCAQLLDQAELKVQKITNEGFTTEFIPEN